jgi:hypothetical protein
MATLTQFVKSDEQKSQIDLISEQLKHLDPYIIEKHVFAKFEFERTMGETGIDRHGERTYDLFTFDKCTPFANKLNSVLKINGKFYCKHGITNDFALGKDFSHLHFRMAGY